LASNGGTSKRNLVLIHGFMGAGSQWAFHTGRFAERFEVHTPDMIGFGRLCHEVAPDTIEAFAEYMLDYLDRTKVQQFDLVGHSMGGMVAQEMALLAPERIKRLVLSSTGPNGEIPGRFETLAESRRRAESEGAINTSMRIASNWFMDGRNSPFYETCARIVNQNSLQVILASLRAMEVWSSIDRLRDIKSKTLVIWGDRDQTYQWDQVEQLWKGIDDASLSVIPDAGHAVHLEKPELFHAIINDFLGDEQS
jgi:2-hydroxy-6-oxonona-2,4-dienedioate hydrolase